jgi:hypothetical protein
MTPVAARKYLEDALPFGVWAEASRVLGRNHAYIQQYITRGTPRWLGEQDRHILARAYGLDEDRLRPPPRLPRVGAKKAGVHRRDDADVSPQRFDEIIDDPRALELIHACLRIVGDDEKKTALDVLTALGEASLRALRGLVAAGDADVALRLAESKAKKTKSTASAA